ncbi:MAG: M15 family metallopeptidase [Selenomonadaceae bacterium]|nr:M15 family metallopeptidase [Selenomonadaceae bacterium]
MKEKGGATLEQAYVSSITDEIFARIDGLSYKADCPLPLEDLRYLRFLHRDIHGSVLVGEMICHVCIVHDLIDIFKRLYQAGYPVEKIRLIDEYGADDEISMRDNNSSCFNFRFISHTRRISKHGLGLAVDVNPLYNPYVKTVAGRQVSEPATAAAYCERQRDFPYKLQKGDLCYRLFTEHGFLWGGDWTDRKDYQHFEVSDEMAAILGRRT